MQGALLTEAGNSSHTSDNRNYLNGARAVMVAVKSLLPGGQFDVADKTLFVSSESACPRAVFAVVLIGIPGGLVPVEFDVPQTVDALAKELAAALIDVRATWGSEDEAY
jgi:hypothetical protein